MATLKSIRTDLYNRANEILSVVDVWNLDAGLNSRTLKDIHHATSYQKLGATLQPLLAIQALIRSKLPATVEVCRIMQSMNHLIEDVDYATRQAA